MTPWIAAATAGLAAGLVASLAMNLYQGATASLFAQGESDDDPATVKAADSATIAATGRRVTQKRRGAAGGLVHYALGAGLSIGYALLVTRWPPAAIGFGVAFGLAVALVLDDLLVPAFGWGAWPWQTPLATHAYGLSAHMVFGAVLEGVRRLAFSVIG